MQFHLNTFSITARCKKTGMMGVAVSTARPAVGGLCPYVKAGVGAIATQAFVNPYYGIDGLKYLESGMSASETMERLLQEDEGREQRQLAIVDAQGRTAAFTGKETVPWQGHLVGDQYVVAGNMLTGEETIRAMANACEEHEHLPLHERLMQALLAGQKAGGDKRGKQSAALYVVNDTEYPFIDIRADEHPNPVEELFRIYEVCKTDLFPLTDRLVKR